MQLKHLFLSLLLLPAISAMAQDNPAPAKPAPVYNYVEAMPEPGYDIGKYLAQNMHYPDQAKKNKIEGRVILKFIVNEDGSITDCVVLRGIGGGCDEEALRVVKNMPAWKPGRQNGKAVKVNFNLPVIFSLAP